MDKYLLENFLAYMERNAFKVFFSFIIAAFITAFIGETQKPGSFDWLLFLVLFPAIYVVTSIAYKLIMFNLDYIKRKIRILFFVSFILISLISTSLLALAYISLFQLLLILSLAVSFFIGLASFLNPFWMYNSVGKRKMKAIVLFSFFATLAFFGLGFFYNEYFFVFAPPFMTIFLIQFIIDALNYFIPSDPKWGTLSVLMQYIFFRYLIVLVVLLARMIARVIARRR